jgi:hypothetical protein
MIGVGWPIGDVLATEKRQERSPQALAGAAFAQQGSNREFPGFPDGMMTTHADVINADLLGFIRS